METRRFLIADSLSDGAAYHFTWSSLDTAPARFAHTHDYYELSLIERGAAWHWVNGETALLSEGALLFIRPDDRHWFRARRRTGCRIINVMFRTESADHLVARYGDDLAGRYFWTDAAMPEVHLMRGPRMERAINTALELQTARRSLARIEDFLLAMMTRVVDYAVTGHAAMPPWLAMACQAAQRPEVFRRGAAGFVASAGRGHEHVCRMARRHLGITPSVYVNRIRMQYAAMALGSSDQSISSIALDCGIENMSHFYKLFRAHYGVTPRAYRTVHARNPVQPTDSASTARMPAQPS